MAQREYIDDCIKDVNFNLSEIFEDVFQRGVAQGVNAVSTPLSEDETKLIALYRSCTEDGRADIYYQALHKSQQQVIYLERDGNKIIVKGRGK